MYKKNFNVYIIIYTLKGIFNMNYKRINDILSTDEKIDVFYQNRPVWIQGVSDTIAKIGFVDTFEEQDVSIDELSE